MLDSRKGILIALAICAAFWIITIGWFFYFDSIIASIISAILFFLLIIIFSLIALYNARNQNGSDGNDTGEDDFPV